MLLLHYFEEPGAFNFFPTFYLSDQLTQPELLYHGIYIHPDRTQMARSLE
jgi:hypothetical protein